MKVNSLKKSAGIACIAVIGMMALLLTGCQSPDLKPIKAGAGLSTPDTRVVLAPGDQLDIRFFYTPELNDLQLIRADGKITLQLVGDVDAEGKTPSELQQALEKKYTGLIEKPSVAVIARNLNHRNIYVAGSVKTPGLLPMPGHTSALEAIMQAGGFDMKEADTKEVIVIRNEDGERTAYALDLSGSINGEMPNDPFYLHAQDIVYVQRTGAVKAAQWINQHITQLIPQTGFTFFHTSGPNTIGIDTSAR
jgi:protein involved in polysaccharide export with SLBB domain